MAQYRLRPRAAVDLEEIGDHIAAGGNPARALSFVAEVEETCQKLAEFPHMGRGRGELRPGLRSFPHGDYLIIYRPASYGADIIRIVHGKRDLRRLFRP